MVGILSLVAFCCVALALKPGGDRFEIYLNKKLVLKQFLVQSQAVQKISFDKVSSTDQLTVYYSHCGQIGKSRSLTLKDGKGHNLKEWKFPDAQGTDQGMTILLKELVQASKGADWTLVYSSRELPGGRTLASIGLPSKNVASVESFEFVVGTNCFTQCR